MGLLVDVPKQGGGNTNASEITDVNKTLLDRFSIILTVLSCGFEIEKENFRQYAEDEETVELYVQKILIHGADVMESLLL